ncbi:DHA2 family efflux MFS transporter permease subunit [Streptacidiphilus rugosus]|uniref:DHA2 family efflux MFS transporter permease subunit n=1 Tax=Streptacidiphilus rugosus TaxID=405783 RepID=UPI0007C7F491
MTARRVGLLRNQRVIVPVMFVAIAFIVIVDGAITIVALPSIAARFQLSPAALDGVVVVYPVCLGVMIPASAWLLGRFGGRRMLVLALAVFTLASALCGAAQSLPQLIVFRGLQGLAAGLLTPVAQGLLFRTFSQREQVRLARFTIIPQQLAPTLAPLLGGVLVTSLDWRWVFLVNVPVGVVAAVFGLCFLDEHREQRPDRLDLPGLLLSGGALGALMYGVCAGPDLGWAAPPVLSALGVGGVLLALTVRTELRTAQPALRLRLFADRMFRKAGWLSLVGMVPVLGPLFLVPLFVQQAQGRSALASGSTTFVEAAGVLLTVQVVGVLYHRVGPGPIVGVGLLGVGGVNLLLAGSDAHTSLWTLRLDMFLLGVAMGGFFMPVTVASLATLDRADSAQAATLGTVVRQTGSALAPAVVTAVLVFGTAPSAAGHPPVSAYRLVFLVLAAIALLTGLFALTLGRPSPASAAARPPVSAASASRPVRALPRRIRPTRPRPPHDDRAPVGTRGSTP